MEKLQKGNQKSTGAPHNRTPPPLATLEEFSARLKALQRERTNLLKEFRDLLTTQEMERTKKYLANHD